jgi:hypothetical protein
MSPHDLRLLSFPSADATFGEDVERAARHLTDGMSSDDCRAVLLVQLRPWYRAVEIVEQDELAHLDPRPFRVWYLYRDGRDRPENEGRERL